MGILSEAFKQHPVENKYISPIDFNSIKNVPESHAWVDTSDSKNPNNNNNIIKQELLLTSSIPLIDLNDPNIIDKIYNACKNWGFLQIINHGVSNEIVEKLETQVMKLFNLPYEEKMKVLRSPESAAGYGSPRISPFFPKKMWAEGFTILANSLFHHAKLLWPQNDDDDFRGFCDVMEEYQAQMKALSDKLLALILKSLNIPESEMTWINDDPKNLSTALQLNSYPKCPNPASTMGLAQHTDSFLFTILHQSGSVSGLQVYKDGPEWVSVDPIPGALVVNSGDLLHIISNGRFPSVVHRAIVNNEVHRISVAYFYGPPLGFRVSPYVGYPNCDGPKYKGFTIQEYVGIKSKLLESALSSIRIN
ncbi:hypothetical protein RND81_08G079600 [Saponaria officinalis]|uniref:gibberellin 3beta-dioxygenase n=1 Tax=Saponaria officinalis TaxID=3572 RepID=A0AAW1J533_SAPOF